MKLSCVNMQAYTEASNTDSLVQRYEIHKLVSAVRSVVGYRDGCECETFSGRNINLQYSAAAVLLCAY